MLELQSASEARGGEVTASLIGTRERPSRRPGLRPGDRNPDKPKKPKAKKPRK
jgi:hypothetical protein